MGDPTSDERSGGSTLVTFVRTVVIVAGALALAPVVASLLLRQFSVATPWAVAYVAATPFVAPAGLVAIVLLLAARAWLGAAIATALTVTLVLSQAPLYFGTAPPDGSRGDITVMTVNIHNGGAIAADVVANVRRYDVDLLMVQELTPAAVTALADAGLDDTLPSSVLRPGRDASGNGMWSRTPIEPLEPPEGFSYPPVAGTIDVDGRSVFVAGVHPRSPYPDDTEHWASDLDGLVSWLGAVDGLGIVGGDFNATYDHRPFRDILAAGYRDAAEQDGAGFLPTFPANRRRIPLLITIDHLLVRGGVVATNVRRISIGATDHEALVVDVSVPGLGFGEADP